MAVEIKISELLDVITRILQSPRVIEATLTIDDSEDQYWDMSVDEMCDVGKRPDLDIGSMTDDWSFLKSLLGNRDEAFPLMLIHVAAILKIASKKLPNY